MDRIFLEDSEESHGSAEILYPGSSNRRAYAEQFGMKIALEFIASDLRSMAERALRLTQRVVQSELSGSPKGSTKGDGN